MADEKIKDEQLEEELDDVEETEDGDNRGKEDEAGKKNGGNDGADKKQEKTFTQEQVNKMMTREKKQGRLAALKELGIDPKDTKAVAMVKALLESQKTDDQKAAEKAADDARAKAESDRRVLIAETKAEAMVAGIQSQYVDDIVALVLAKVGDDEDSDLKAIIGEYKTKYPAWFKEAEEDGTDKSKSKKAGQRGTGSSIKSNSGNSKKNGEQSLGARLAAQRKSISKSSYWGGKR